MSVTGILLTYERQMVGWAEREQYAAPTATAEPLPLEEVLAVAKLARPDFTPTTIMVRNDASAPVTLGAGRDGTLFANPYTGAVAEPGATSLDILRGTGWHRWFNASGEIARPRHHGASNVLVSRRGYCARGNGTFRRTYCSTSSPLQSRDFQCFHARNLPRCHSLVSSRGLFVSMGQQPRLSQRRRRAAGARWPARGRSAGRRGDLASTTVGGCRCD
jgi:hypothetical protein